MRESHTRRAVVMGLPRSVTITSYRVVSSATDSPSKLILCGTRNQISKEISSRIKNLAAFAGNNKLIKQDF